MQAKYLETDITRDFYDLESIEAMKKFIKKAKYDKEIKKVFYNILDARLADIQHIENCESLEELDLLAKDLYDRDIQSHFSWAYKGYENIISVKRNSLKKKLICSPIT